jgi:hypothetical protein
MTEPVQVGELLPGVLVEARRDGGGRGAGYDRWCRAGRQAWLLPPPDPPRRQGRTTPDRTTGEVRTALLTRTGSQTGVLLRRAAPGGVPAARPVPATYRP